MKIALYSRPQTSYTASGLSHLLGALQHSGLTFQVNRDFAAQITAMTDTVFSPDQVYTNAQTIDSQCKVMISYGGDGTFLGAVRMLNNRPIPIIGINSGRLGFLANIAKQEMEEAFRELAQGHYTIQERSLLHAQGEFTSTPHYPYAFNEMTIQRQGTNMISTEVFVDGEMIATYHGDGVLVSTPTGSTAYSLSVGGPVVSPECNCLIISPIAPHNLSMRPVVVPDKSILTFRIHTREEACFVSLDNRNYEAVNEASLQVKKAENSIFLVNLRNISFYDTLRNKMMWGVDGRDGLK